MQRFWATDGHRKGECGGMKATTIPVVIGGLGLIKKGLEEYTKQIQGNIKISELQKIALLGTSRILRKTLSIK